MKKIGNPFIDNLPSIDLHGYDSISALIEIKSFIRDSIKLGVKDIAVIHGKGKLILKKSIHEYLKKEKSVLSFKTDYFNDGVTLITLK